MTPERIEEIKREYSEPQKWAGDPAVVNELLAALEEAEQEKIKFKTECERLDDICRQLVGEEMMFQEGQYETEMQSLENKLAEAQHTIARQREALEEIKSKGAYAGNNKYYHIASAALKEGAQP